MTAAPRDPRPVELAPAAAFLLAVVFTLVPHAAGSGLLSTETARTVTLHTEVAP